MEAKTIRNGLGMRGLSITHVTMQPPTLESIASDVERLRLVMKPPSPVETTIPEIAAIRITSA